MSNKGNSKYGCWEAEANLGRVKEERPERQAKVAKERPHSILLWPWLAVVRGVPA